MSKACVTKRYNCSVARNSFTKASASVDRILYATKTLRGPAGVEGPAGPPGPSGDFTVISDIVAGEDIGIYDVVYVENNTAFIASNDDVPNARKLGGLALSNVTTGNLFTVITSGFVENPAWNWSTTSDLFLGLNGQLTETAVTPDETLVHREIAETLSPTRIVVRVQEPILFDCL